MSIVVLAAPPGLGETHLLGPTGAGVTERQNGGVGIILL
jgi:hypothetical protein